MKKKISTLPFNGTVEQEARLMEVIAQYKDDKSQLMKVMQDAQEKTYKVVLDFEGQDSEEIKAIMNNEDDEYDYSIYIEKGINKEKAIDIKNKFPIKMFFCSFPFKFQ